MSRLPENIDLDRKGLTLNKLINMSIFVRRNGKMLAWKKNRSKITDGTILRKFQAKVSRINIKAEQRAIRQQIWSDAE